MPGFIKDIWSSGKDFFINIGITLLMKMVDRAIPDDEVVAAGEKIGKIITDNAKRALGDKWNLVEDSIQEHAGLFFDGLEKGLDYDDKG